MNKLSILAGAMIAGVSFASMATVEAATSAPKLVKNVLTVEVGDYVVDFRGDACWTLGNVTFQRTPVLRYTGANQSVVNMKRDVQSGPEPWIGSSHGGEVVESVALEVDGEVYPIGEGFAAPIGNEYALVKSAQLGPMRTKTRTTVSEKGVHQTLSFEAIEALELARYAYVFMHCWSPSFNKWVAIEANGAVISETFPSVKETTLKKDISMLALYAPDYSVGVVMSYPEPYEGEPGHSNFLSNWPDRHNKHYLRMLPEAMVGKEFSATITAFSAPDDQWQEEAEKIHRANAAR